LAVLAVAVVPLVLIPGLEFPAKEITAVPAVPRRAAAVAVPVEPVARVRVVPAVMAVPLVQILIPVVQFLILAEAVAAVLRAVLPARTQAQAVAVQAGPVPQIVAAAAAVVQDLTPAVTVVRGE
jgi:hypothetical protein